MMKHNKEEKQQIELKTTRWRQYVAGAAAGNLI
jgi:hypothetical protein